MRVQITAASSFSDKNEIIEANSIDEAIKRVQTDKKLIQSLINSKHSWIDNEEDIYSFIIYTTGYKQDFDIRLVIYDYYVE